MVTLNPLQAADAPAVARLVADLWSSGPEMLRTYTIQQSIALDCAVAAALIRSGLEWAIRQQVIVHFEADVAYVPQRVIFESAPATHINRDFLSPVTA